MLTEEDGLIAYDEKINDNLSVFSYWKAKIRRDLPASREQLRLLCVLSRCVFLLENYLEERRFYDNERVD